MTGTSIAGGTDERFASDWQAVRNDPALQFDPVDPPVPATPPDWLIALGRWFNEMMAGMINAFGSAWPVVKLGLIALGLAALALLARHLWRLYTARQGDASPAADRGWQPDSAAALALLEDADALAAAGRYGEAAHLLLQRSVGQIAAARPDWLAPSTTAREIARLPALPDRARTAFGAIAGAVERALFARRSLDKSEWQTARAAYANFADVSLAAP